MTSGATGRPLPPPAPDEPFWPGDIPTPDRPTPAGSTAGPPSLGSSEWAWDVPLDDDLASGESGFREPDPTGEIPIPPMRIRLRRSAPSGRSLLRILLAIALPLAVLFVALLVLEFAMGWGDSPSEPAQPSTAPLPDPDTRIEITGDPLIAARDVVTEFFGAIDNGNYDRAAALTYRSKTAGDLEKIFPNDITFRMTVVETTLTGRERYSVRAVFVETEQPRPEVRCVQFSVRPNGRQVIPQSWIDVTKVVEAQSNLGDPAGVAVDVCRAQALA